MLGAMDSVGVNAWQAFAPRPCHAMIAIDEVVSARGNLRKDHRAREVRCGDRQLVQPWAGAAVVDFGWEDRLGMELSKSADVAQEP